MLAWVLVSLDGRLSSLSILHIHKLKDVDIDDVITEFALPFACKHNVSNIVLPQFVVDYQKLWRWVK